MQNKTNRWLDVQIVIATIALTFSLALWNLFAGSNRSVNTGSASTTSQNTAVSLSVSQPSTRILLGGSAPQSPSTSAPAPVTSTGSSRP